MQNPANKMYAAVLCILFGILIGSVPGIIKADELRSERDAAVEASKKQIADLQAKISALVNHDMTAQQTAEDRSKYQTILISNFGPVPHRNVIGVEEPWSHLDMSTMPGTIWVIPGRIEPHTVMPDPRAAWAVVAPDGHVGRWSMPTFVRGVDSSVTIGASLQ